MPTSTARFRPMAACPIVSSRPRCLPAAGGAGRYGGGLGLVGWQPGNGTRSGRRRARRVVLSIAVSSVSIWQLVQGLVELRVRGARCILAFPWHFKFAETRFSVISNAGGLAKVACRTRVGVKKIVGIAEGQKNTRTIHELNVPSIGSVGQRQGCCPL